MDVAPHNVAILHHIAVHSVCSTAEKSQNKLPDNTIVGGSVATHAMMICQTTRFCTPEQVRITRSHRKFTLSCGVGPCRVRPCPVGRYPVGPRRIAPGFRVAPATRRFVPTVKLTERS
jgi:hypothetical protein